MKKIFIGILTASLLCVLTTLCFTNDAIAAVKSADDFTDLKDLDAQNKAKFDELLNRGILEGLNEDEHNFGLNKTMTRAEFAKVAAMIFDLDVDTSSKVSSFADVNPEDARHGYYVPYIEAIKAAKITDGYSEANFAPNDKVTNEQLAAFLVKGLGYDLSHDWDVSNDDSISDWAKDYVAAAMKAGLVSNGADGKFGGKSNATRNMIVHSSIEAEEQYNVLKEQKKKAEDMPSETKDPSDVDASTESDEASDSDDPSESDDDSSESEDPSESDDDSSESEDPSESDDDSSESDDPSESDDDSSESEDPSESDDDSSESEDPSESDDDTSDSDDPSESDDDSSDSEDPPAQSVVETPAAFPADATVTTDTYITLTTATIDAVIYFTTDLSEPTVTSTPYTEPFKLTSNTTIKAIAVKPDWINSAIATFEYTVFMPIVLPDSISPMTEGESYTGSVAKLSGGSGDVTYAVSDGALPAGLTLNPSTGEISGTPNVSGEYLFTIKVTDSAAYALTVTKQYTAVVAPAVSVSPLDLINAASKSAIWTDVDEDTFAEAGITGITSENLYNIQYYLDPGVYTNIPFPRTADDIQTIVDLMIQDMMVAAIYDYLNSFGSGSRPTVEVFTLAGITGVDETNLEAILDELVLAYQESLWDMFGTPMSTKQDIQDVVDRYIAV